MDALSGDRRFCLSAPAPDALFLTWPSSSARLLWRWHRMEHREHEHEDATAKFERSNVEHVTHREENQLRTKSRKKGYPG